jgi:hypothetical protein
MFQTRLHLLLVDDHNSRSTVLYRQVILAELHNLGLSDPLDTLPGSPKKTQEGRTVGDYQFDRTVVVCLNGNQSLVFTSGHPVYISILQITSRYLFPIICS